MFFFHLEESEEDDAVSEDVAELGDEPEDCGVELQLLGATGHGDQVEASHPQQTGQQTCKQQ